MRVDLLKGVSYPAHKPTYLRLQFKFQIIMDSWSEGDSSAINGCELLNSLSTVKNLTLYGYFIECLSYKEDLFEALPICSHLTELELSRVGAGLNCKGTSTILRRCPQLRTLKFSGGFNDFIQQWENVLEPMPSCFVTHLKKIEIMFLEGTPGDIGFLSILLKASMVLEEAVTTWDEETEEELGEDIDEIMMLPIGSESCRFTFCVDPYFYDPYNSRT